MLGSREQENSKNKKGARKYIKKEQGEWSKIREMGPPLTEAHTWHWRHVNAGAFSFHMPDMHIYAFTLISVTGHFSFKIQKKGLSFHFIWLLPVILMRVCDAWILPLLSPVQSVQNTSPESIVSRIAVGESVKDWMQGVDLSRL